MRSILGASTALALVLAASTAAASGQPGDGAQADILVEPAYASLGDSVSGELVQGDSRTQGDGLMDRYVLDLSAGTRVEIIMRSAVFDTYLIAGFLGADGFEQIALDDDGLGEELNSRLRFTAAETGRYEIRSRGFAAMGEGAYTLTFGEQAGAQPGHAPGSLALGSEAQGALTDGDAVSEWDDTYRVDDYQFSARAGDRVEAVVRSDAFDTTVAVSRTSRWGVTEQIAFDDDGLGEGTNSRARFISPSDGDYILRVSSFAPNSTGDYVVRLERLEPWPEPVALGFGQTISSALLDTDALGDDDQPFDAYVFDGEVGQRIELLGLSSSFPMQLTLGPSSAPAVWAPAVYGGNFAVEEGPARMIFTVPEAGRYELRVASATEGLRGDYSITLNDRGPLPPPPPPGSITVGDTINGALSEGDGISADEKTFDDYNIETRPGQRLSVTMRSEGFDTFLNIYRIEADGSLTDVTSDDDSAGNLDSRATFDPEGGIYRIRATSYSADGSGDYSLVVRDLGPLPRPTRIRLGRTYRGVLDTRDPLTDAEGPFDSYGFSLEAGERAQFVARSDAFDTFLTVVRRVDDQHEFMVFDNDGLGDGGTNSRLTFVAPEAGYYELWVTPLPTTEGSGAYRLETRALGPSPQSQPIAFGSTVQGRLQEGDGLAYEGTLYDGYTFTGTAGQRIRVDMSSEDFDAFLLVGIHSAEGLNAIGENDDVPGEGTDSSLSMVLPADAQYEVWATSYAVGENGAYALTLTDLGPEPEPGSLLIGSTVRGELMDQDPVGSSGTFYDAFQFQGELDHTVRITATSNAFDTYLELGRWEDGVFTQLVEDDDGLSDLNSLITFTFPETGAYVVRVRSYGPGEVGDYVLTVEEVPAI